jgi:2'-5' RNA ligase
VPYTAAVLIPPERIWEPIQAIRRQHDPQIARWMPHVTLLYPFVETAVLAEAAHTLRPAVQVFPSFTVRLSEFDCFIHSRTSATIWLRPAPSDPVVRLQSRLLGLVPWCDDTGRFAGGFTPHLSVGRWPEAGARQAAAELRKSWKPLDWQVESVCLIARPQTGGQPFAVHHVLALAGASG